VGALRRKGWHNHPLFLTDDGLLFGCIETPEGCQAALDGGALESVNIKWLQFMPPCLEAFGGLHPDESMVQVADALQLN